MDARLAGFAGFILLTSCSASEAPVKKFVPPDATQRIKAIGSTDNLPRPIARAFDPNSHFQPIPEPKPGDWLAEHSEPGQTFQQYVASRPNLPDPIRKTIYLQPFGDLDADRGPKMQDLADVCAANFGLPVKVLPTKPLDPKLTSRVNRGTQKPQYLTHDFLHLLGKSLPKDAYCCLGLLQEDLYPDEKWNFVFGQASLQNRVGVYSFARFDPAFFGQERPENYKELLLERSCGTLVHETAHMFGMQHCVYFHCVLNGSNHQAESDAAPLHFCPVCLRKLHHATHADPLERLKACRDVHRRIGLIVEADWCAERLRFVEAK